MLLKQAQQLGKSEIQQRGMSVRSLWSGEERRQRRIVAHERQQLLFNMLNWEAPDHWPRAIARLAQQHLRTA